MHVSLFCVGRMKAGPEKALFERYFERAGKTGAHIGLTRFSQTEIPESRAATAEARKAEESAKLLSACEDPATALIIFDEAGKSLSSRQFAQMIADLRDRGTAKALVAIGGPDGHDEAARARANAVISFGKLTMPHQIVRILAAEQLYRATAILSGHPYHRD